MKHLRYISVIRLVSWIPEIRHLKGLPCVMYCIISRRRWIPINGVITDRDHFVTIRWLADEFDILPGWRNVWTRPDILLLVGLELWRILERFREVILRRCVDEWTRSERLLNVEVVVMANGPFKICCESSLRWKRKSFLSLWQSYKTQNTVYIF